MTRDLRKPFWRRIPMPRMRSLRVRLQVWYTCLILAVVGLFGGLVYARAAAETHRRIDADLEGAVLVVEAVLRGFPPHELGHLPPGKLFKPAPGKKQREDFLVELETPRAFAERGGYFAAWQADGTLIKSAGLVGEPRSRPHDIGDRPVFGGHDGYREAWIAGPFGSRIVVGRSFAEDYGRLHRFGFTLIGIGLATVALGIAINSLIARRIARPIETMSEAAAAITGDDLSERIDVRGADAELANLAQVLNAMLARLQAAFERQQQFTADASHELRTPLSIIRSQSELALSRPRTPEEYRNALQSCLRAAERMSTLAQALLTLARSDAGKSISLQNVAFHELVADCVHQLQASAAAKKVTLTASLMPVVLAGNGERLTQVVTNLITNAIKFNREGGLVDVRLTTTDADAVLTVRDNGPGIPARDQEKIFERFYRVDKSRARAAGGAGLGLAICKTLVESHQGAITLESVEGEGATFQVRLPRQRAV